MLDVAYHTIILVYLSTGWGYWLWQLTGRRALFRHLWWFWCSLGGFCLQALIVQECFYAGISLSIVVCLIALLAGGGWLLALRHVRHAARAQKQLFAWQAAALFVAGSTLWLGQGFSLFGRNPSHYFGRATHDQVNYVLLAQYLADAPHDLAVWQVGLRPWLVKGIIISKQRITQSIVHAELVVLSGQDAQSTYGTLPLFYIVILGMTITALLRVWKAPWKIALLGGIWAGILPAVTRASLDGFLSQTATLWVPAAIAGVLARKPLSLAHAAVCGVFLAFFMGAYAEFSFLGAGAVIFGILLIAPRKQWPSLFVVAFSVTVVCSLGYLSKFAGFFSEQLSNASNLAGLGALAPDSGTFAGWARNFTGEFPWTRRDLTIIGVVNCLLVAEILVFSNQTRARRFLVLLVTPVAAAASLLLMPKFLTYAFAKLLMSSTPTVIAMVTAGAFAFRSRINRMTMGLIIGAGLLVSFAWLYTAHRAVLAGTEPNIDQADLSRLRKTLSILDSNKQEYPVVVVDTESELSAAWLAYYLRDRDIYLARQNISDLFMPSELCDCRQIPRHARDVIVISQDQIVRRDSIESLPALNSPDAKEQRLGRLRTWTAQGHCTVKITRDPSAVGILYEWFCFKARPEIPGEDLSLWVSNGINKKRISTGTHWALLVEMRTTETILRFESTRSSENFTLVPLGFEPVRSTFTEPPPSFNPVILPERAGRVLW